MFNSVLTSHPVKPGAAVWLLFLMLSCLFFSATGCDQGDEGVTIDFSETTTTEEQFQAAEDKPLLRGAVSAMISPRETFSLYRDILLYVSDQLDMELEFVQRKTYAEVNELLGKGDIDLAFLCSGPYVRGRDRHGFRLLAAPIVDGDHNYYSYLIVHRDSPYSSLEDLQGKSFAFTDPDSNTGRLVPSYWVRTLGSDPEDYFSRIIFTYGHDNSIMAVARGLVDAAAVDSLIWDYYDRFGSEITAQTRIIKQSEPYGMPPLVLSPEVDPGLSFKLEQVLLEMHADDQGKRILDQLLIERFVTPRDSWYDSIRSLLKSLEPDGGENDQNP
jgi:phosphonate transport system substrate-binding protein